MSAEAAAESVGERAGWERWGLTALVVTAVAALWLLIGIWVVMQKERVMESGHRELTQLTRAVALHTDGVFRSAETALRTLALVVAAFPKSDPRTDPHILALVDELRTANDQLLDLRLLGANGKVFAIPMPDARAAADDSGQPYFMQMRDMSGRSLLIGEPRLDVANNRWEIPLTWRLETPVAGIIAVGAFVDLDRLAVRHERMRMKPDGSIVTMRLDGVVLSDTSKKDSLLGKSLREAPNFSKTYGVSRFGSFVTDGSYRGGAARLVSFERLQRYAATVLVSQSEVSVLTAWRARRTFVLAGGAAMTLVLSILAAFLQRTMRDRRLAERAMRRLAATDSLTGVANRRALLEMAQRDFSRARRYSTPLSLLALDIDHFKRLNDLHGHAAGDLVLHECAKMWSAALREQDLLGRTGGEEFCVILPETPAEVAIQIAERLCRSTARMSFPGLPEGVTVNVSIGVAELESSDTSLAEVMCRADRALYEAKAKGRNRVEWQVRSRNAMRSEAFKTGEEGTGMAPGDVSRVGS